MSPSLDLHHTDVFQCSALLENTSQSQFAVNDLPFCIHICSVHIISCRGISKEHLVFGFHLLSFKVVKMNLSVQHVKWPDSSVWLMKTAAPFKWSGRCSMQNTPHTSQLLINEESKQAGHSWTKPCEKTAEHLMWDLLLQGLFCRVAEQETPPSFLLFYFIIVFFLELFRNATLAKR